MISDTEINLDERLLYIILELYAELNGAAAYRDLMDLFDTDAAAADSQLAEFIEQNLELVQTRMSNEQK